MHLGGLASRGRGKDMTEAEWLLCDDPVRVLDSVRGRVSDRKLRLFACASCLHFWQELDDAWSRKVVEVAVEAADDEARNGELGSLDSVARHAAEASAYPATAWAAADLTLSNPWHAAVRVAHRWDLEQGRSTARALAAEVFGNPFRPIAADPAWLTPTVVSLAQAAYEQRAIPSGQLDPARLAVLADAVEEAGCQEQSILAHLRGPGPHVRGCWPLDLILNKE
jgi:hypothetical protein